MGVSADHIVQVNLEATDAMLPGIATRSEFTRHDPGEEFRERTCPSLASVSDRVPSLQVIIQFFQISDLGEEMLQVTACKDHLPNGTTLGCGNERN